MPTPLRRTLPLGLFAATLALSPALAAPSRALSEITIAGRRALFATPEGVGRETPLPLLVVLHWSGSTPEEIAALADWPALPVRTLFPQGAHPRPTGWSWFPRSYAELAGEAAWRETLRAVDELATWLDAARRELPATGPPLVAGVSYGGDLALLLALHRPESVSAAYPIGARFLPEWRPATQRCGAACPPIVALHGEADATVPIGPTREGILELARRGYPAELRSYPGAGHEFSAAMRADLERAIARQIVAPASGDRAVLVAALTAQAAAWDRAIVLKDRAAIEANLAEEFRQIDGHGHVEDRATFVAGLISPELEIDPYTVEELEVRLYSDVALLTGRTRMTGRFRGAPFASHYRYTDTYVREGGVWKVVQVQITRIADPPGRTGAARHR